MPCRKTGCLISRLYYSGMAEEQLYAEVWGPRGNYIWDFSKLKGVTTMPAADRQK